MNLRTELFYFVTFLQFILPLAQLIIKKRKKWFKRITVFGWVLISSGVASGILTYAIQEKKHPKLGVFQGPTFQKRIAHYTPIAMSIKNYGSASAKNINARMISIDDYFIYFMSTEYIIAPPSDEKEISPDAAYTYYINFELSKYTLDAHKINVPMQTYLYLRLSYTDEFSKPSNDTTREIYIIPYPASSTAPILHAQWKEFNQVKSILKASKFW